MTEKERRYPMPSGDPADYVWGDEKHHQEVEEYWTHSGRVPDEEARRVFKVLDEFARAWYTGELGAYVPDPLWTWAWLGRDLTDEEVENLVWSVYEEHQLEAKGWFAGKGYQAAVPWPAFPPNAQRCLAQRIVAVLDMEKPEPELNRIDDGPELPQPVSRL